MKEQNLSEIMQFIAAQSENNIERIAEITRFIDENKLLYILTFINKMFGHH